MSLEIYLDPKDPLAYLALPGTSALLQQTNCAIQWFPMQVSAWSDPGPKPAVDASRGERHRWFRASYRERELQYYASVHDLSLTNLYRQTDSTHAALALLWLTEQEASSTRVLNFLQRLAKTYWADPNSQMEKITSIQPLLADTATDTSADTNGFSKYCAQQGPAALAQQLAMNVQLGVIRGPAYRFADQLYIGREHLPLLAELISG